MYTQIHKQKEKSMSPHISSTHKRERDKTQTYGWDGRGVCPECSDLWDGWAKEVSARTHLFTLCSLRYSTLQYNIIISVHTAIRPFPPSLPSPSLPLFCFLTFLPWWWLSLFLSFLFGPWSMIHDLWMMVVLLFARSFSTFYITQSHRTQGHLCVSVLSANAIDRHFFFPFL